MNLDDFIKENLSVSFHKSIRLKNYQAEIVKILDAGLTVKHAHKFLTENYPELKNISLRNLYLFVSKIKKAKAGQAEPEKPISPVGQIKAVIPELIQPATEAPPVNLQEKFKEKLANVRSENYVEIIEQKPKDTRPGRSVLKPEKVDEWQEHRKKMGLPNTIDDEWRTKPDEE